MTRVHAGSDKLRRDLEAIVGSKRVSTREADLVAYSRDMWPRLLLAVRESGFAEVPRPHVVVWPQSTREVAAIVRTARAHQLPIIPYGGGSGVCGGVVPLYGGITVDIKRMDAIQNIDRDEMLCAVEAGVNGERFERALTRRGFTFGNFPSSIYCSTVGGWLATRAAGQMSTKYGKVEDRVAGLTVVTGRGDVIETDGLARAARGPNWTQLILGSEGTLGIITAARLRVAVAPALRVLRGYEFESVAHGLNAIRQVMQRGLRPAVVRLYDEVDTLAHTVQLGEDEESNRDPDRFAPVPEPGTAALPRMPKESPASAQARRRGVLSQVSSLFGQASQGGNLRRLLRQGAMSAVLSRPRLFNSLAGTVAERLTRQGCKLIIGLEGARIRTQVEAQLTFDELERCGGRNLGEEPGRDWLEHRYDVSYNMSPLFREGAFVDTMEVASSWERLPDLYDSVRDAIAPHAVVMAHFSHAYSEGCSIYFTFVGQGKTAVECRRIYDAIWRDGPAAATRAGGTISHHHGVGMLKAAHMNSEHREAMAVLRGIKRAFDPEGIMNPGKLGLGAVAGLSEGDV
ncbi:MAG: FAD-binding oxidoreductase [Proteobacteria bacterium]|nr:FAD-binding oxidoreductase [Pseudomonadota bacterium]